MNHLEFRAFLSLLMCSDPWPEGVDGENLLKDWADREARHRGFIDWVEAYHQMEE